MIKNYSQRKKDIDEAQNVSISGDTKQHKGKTINNERMPEIADNHLSLTVHQNKTAQQIIDEVTHEDELKHHYLNHNTIKREDKNK